MTAETRRNDGFGSPRRVSLDSLGFCSAPTSPRRRTLAVRNGFDDFEFETSRRFAVESNTHSRKESLPAMAFADELFCDGKVMPLKLPPRLEYSNDDRQSSASPSPRSPGVLKLPFQRRSLWNDEFDPFMAALKNVKEATTNHRRTSGSTSPEMWHSDQSRPMGCQDQVKKSPIKLEEPKGVVFARRARLVKMGHEKEKPRKHSVGVVEARESGRQKLNKFLFRSASLGNINFTKKFSFRNMGMGLTQYNEEKRVSQVTRMTLVQYRPKLLLCMGFGSAKYVH